MKTNLKKLEKSQVEIEFELTAEEFGKHLDKALTHLKSHVKMDGFRKGHVPAGMVEEKVGRNRGHNSYPRAYFIRGSPVCAAFCGVNQDAMAYEKDCQMLYSECPAGIVQW